MRKAFPYFLLALAIIALDQAIKLLVHGNMAYGMAGEVKVLGDWFKLHYTLNPGMAFGLQLGEPWGKLILSLFRLITVGAIAWYLVHSARTGATRGMMTCIALILGGAVGNLIDSTFYGIWLHNAPADAPTPWFHGQVIDMFYVDLWEGQLPDWMPLIGGQWYAFWPIFNLADASIFCGFLTLILFQQRLLPKQAEPTEASSVTVE